MATPSLSVQFRLALISIVSASVAVSGCGSGIVTGATASTSTTTTTTTNNSVQGVVLGGQQPIIGSNVQLFAASTSGRGSAATLLLSSPVVTDGNGNFSLSGRFTCANSTDQVYLIATGSNPATTVNRSPALMTALGSCGNLTSSTPIVINEVTTIASVYALAPYMNSGSYDIASNSGDVTALTAAFTSARTLANLATGTAIATGTIRGIPILNKLNSLADSVASCIDSSSSTALCDTFFTTATPPSSTAVPTNAIAAILDIALNPTNNVTPIYSLATTSVPFQPSLSAAPDDWTLFASSTQVKPTISWATPVPVLYGTALSATQLNATASVPGTFTYSPAAGTIPAVGTDSLTATFTPTNSTTYSTATATVSLVVHPVNQVKPTITWATPAAIAYGTALSATQLNATASVPGTFTYSPAAGTIPAVGTDSLTATFTPTNSTTYSTATASVSLVVTGGTSANVTDIAIGTTVLQSGLKGLGMNISGQDYYDSGQMLRNLVFRNPGFEGETWQSILHCSAVTATTCTDGNVWTQWPANFLQGATYEFIYGAALGQTGTVVSNTAASSSAKIGATISFAAPAKTPSVGDFVIVKMGILGNAQAGWWVGTSGGGTISTEFSDLSPNTPGKQALRIAAAGSGQSASVDSYFDTFAGHSFVQLKGTYQISFRAKGVGGSNQMTISLTRLSTQNGDESFFNRTEALTGSWQDYSFTFSAAETGNSIGTVDLRFGISGANVLLDDVSLTPVTVTSSNPTPFRDEVVSTLVALRPGSLRYMDSGTDFGSSIDNMIAPPFARQRAGASTQLTEEDDVPLGLHEFLQLCQTVGAEPWYTMPPAMSPTEMQNLIQYLGGDASTPYGAKRSALGQAAPWTSVFPVIHLELGNEQWNYSSFAGAAINDPIAYGNRVATIFGAARNSPSYNPASFDLVMGSWAAVPWWSGQEASHSANFDSIAVAPYLFNSLNDTSSNEAIFGPMFAQPESVDSVSTGYMYQQAQAAKTAGKNLVVYEENLSTLSGTASQSMVNAVVPSVASGITMADHMLLIMRDLGVKTQNVWSLPGILNQFNNANGGSETSPLFGAVIDMGGQTNLRRPVFLAEQLTNSAILTNMLATTISGANPTWNQPLSTNDSIQLNGAHELQTFAFSDGAKSRSVVLINLSRTATLPVTFSGTGAPSGQVTVGQLTSANLTDTNETTGTVNITNTTLTNFQPATSYSLPPFSMTVFTWQVN